MKINDNGTVRDLEADELAEPGVKAKNIDTTAGDLTDVTARTAALESQMPIQCTQSEFDTMVHLPGRIYVIFPDEGGDA